MKIITALTRHPGVKNVMRLLNEDGNEARFVGGAVRDAVMGRPLGDIDIATTLHPEKVMELLAAHHIKVIPTGISHGTVTAMVDDLPLEITTLRRDVACDGRHAEVAFTHNWQEDAARRDFTINAMSCSMDGAIHDYFGGMRDMTARIVRFVGIAEERISEDALRILRCFRFATCLNFTLDETALAACKRHATDVCNLSGERIQAEMFKLLAAPNPLEVVALMEEKGILSCLMPCDSNISALAALVRLENELCLPGSTLRRLAILLRSCDTITVTHIKSLASEWKLSVKHRNILQQLALPEMNITPSIPIPAQKKAIRQLGKERFIDLVLLSWAEILRYITDPALVRENYCIMMMVAERWQPPLFPLTGKDLIERNIAAEGKELGNWLGYAESWWEESDYSLTREQLLGKITQLVGHNAS